MAVAGKRVRARIWVLAMGCGGSVLMGACSSTPVKLECQGIRTRIDFGNLTGDQLRFALMELDECERNLRSAEEKDSLRYDNLEDRFTPAED